MLRTLILKAAAAVLIGAGTLAITASPSAAASYGSKYDVVHKKHWHLVRVCNDIYRWKTIWWHHKQITVRVKVGQQCHLVWRYS